MYIVPICNINKDKFFKLESKIRDSIHDLGNDIRVKSSVVLAKVDKKIFDKCKELQNLIISCFDEHGDEEC